MKKIVLIMLAGLLVLCFTGPIQGSDHDGYGDTDRYYYKGSNYNGYSSHHRYKSQRSYPGERRYYSQHQYRDHSRIHREIRKNEERIRKLERKIREYYRKRYHSRRYKYDYYSMRIRQLEGEISRLVHRNRYLKRLLYR